MLLVAPTAYSQTISFAKFGVEQDLSQSQVRTVLQDEDGYLWIGTISGLNRFDGLQFETFGKKDSLAEEWFTASYKASNGHLYFGHWGGGLSYFDGNTHQFHDLEFESQCGFSSVTGLCELDGQLWVATQGGGLWTLNLERHELQRHNGPRGIFLSTVNALSVDDKGRLWLGTNNGLVAYDTRREADDAAAYQLLLAADGLPGDRVTGLTLLKNGDLVTITTAGSVFINTRGNTIDRAGFIYLDQQLGQSPGQVTCLIEDRENHLWIGTTNRGVIRYHPESGRSSVYNTAFGLNYNKVNTLFEDREGNIWIGTDLGLNQFKGEVFLLFDESDSLSNNIVWDIIEDSRRNLWLGTNQGVTRLRFDPQAPLGTLETPQVQKLTVADGLSGNSVLSVFEDREGNLWFGTAYRGLNHYLVKENRLIRYDNANLSDLTIYDINQDREGYLWLATREGAIRMDPSNGELTSYTEENGLGGRAIYRIFKDRDDQLWFSALGGDLAVYNGKFFEPIAGMDTLNQSFIMSMAEDADRNLWLGSYDGGVFKFDGQQFTDITTEQGLSSNTVYSLIFDQTGKLWMGTGKGIDRMDLKTGDIFHYGKEEGFLGVEANPNAVCQDSRGNLWFGTIMGAACYSPEEDRENLVPPVTFIRPYKAGFQAQDFPADGEFEYDQNNLSFSFVGISLTNPRKVLYQYRLLGLEKDWSPTTAFNEAVYSNLGPGEYVFQVRACNNNRVWNEQPAELNFTILPPFWQTLWFYALLLLAGVGAVFGWDKYRTRNLLDAKTMLENQVKKRTVELEQKTNQLSSQNKHITDSLRYAQRIQTALLPSAAELQALFPESFILYSPKEIVSGDFYWVKQVGERKVVALVDCTGHGVPGAFLGLLGHNALSRVVNELPDAQPTDWLERLNRDLADALHREGQTSPDGMAISLLCFDAHGLKLQFAGAGNSLYIVRPAHIDVDKDWRKKLGGAVKVTHPENSFKLIELLGGKRIVNGLSDSEAFAQQEFELAEGDSLYLFTDGFVDQFGGDRGKKFKANRFKQMLLYNQEKNMNQQCALLTETFTEWKGELDQIDDVTIVGIRL
mgnify:CR=1 FL=1